MSKALITHTIFPSVELITPEIAKAYLQHNTNNRSISKTGVDVFAGDMTDGYWQLTGDSIKFATDGELIDGQHRLMAVIKAGTPQQFLVVRNVSKESKRVTDTGKPRGLCHVLDFDHFKNTRALASITRRAYCFHHGVASKNPHITHSRLLCFLQDNMDLVDVATWVTGRHSLLQLIPGGLLGAICFATMRADSAMSDEFFNLLDLPPQNKKHPVTILKTALSNNALRGRKKLDWRYTWAISIKGWNAFYERREISLLKYPIGEAFPIMLGYEYVKPADDSDNESAWISQP
jgi:hypothetical protein